MVTAERIPRTGRARQPAPRFTNPIEKGDALGKLGYTLKRTETPGTYLIRRPDGAATYCVDTTAQHCSCPATVPYCCHLVYADWWAAYDRAKAQLATAYARDLLVHAHEDAFYAAACDLMAVTGVDMWGEMAGWQRAERGRVAQ